LVLLRISKNFETWGPVRDNDAWIGGNFWRTDHNGKNKVCTTGEKKTDKKKRRCGLWSILKNQPGVRKDKNRKHWIGDNKI